MAAGRRRGGRRSATRITRLPRRHAPGRERHAARGGGGGGSKDDDDLGEDDESDYEGTPYDGGSIEEGESLGEDDEGDDEAGKLKSKVANLESEVDMPKSKAADLEPKPRAKCAQDEIDKPKSKAADLEAKLDDDDSDRKSADNVRWPCMGCGKTAQCPSCHWCTD